MSENEIELESLVGAHVLTGAEYDGMLLDGDWAASRILRFCLDGRIYVALEDPEDGYRSCLRSLAVVEGPPIANTFAPIAVTGRMREADRRTDDHVLEFVTATGAIALAVGTEDISDYYPGAVLEFNPEALGHSQSEASR